MEDPLVETTRALFDRFSRRDLPALLALCDEAVEFMPVTAMVAAGGEPYRGHAGITRYMADVARVWEELTVDPNEFHRAGEDTVVAIGRVYAWGVGRVIDAPVGWLWRFGPDGRAVYGRVYESRDEALAAAGLPAQPSSWRNAQRISSIVRPAARHVSSFMRAACGLRNPAGMILVTRRSRSDPG